MLDREHYLAYYQSPHWQAMRQRAIAFYGPHCAVCGDDYKARGDKLDIHHILYFRPGGSHVFYHETMDDLRVLCHRHHPKGKFSAESIRRWRKSYRWQMRTAFFFKILLQFLRFVVRFLFRGRASSSRS